MSHAVIYEIARCELEIHSDCNGDSGEDECDCRCNSCDCNASEYSGFITGENVEKQKATGMSMAMKQLARRLQPLPLCLVLFLTVCLLGVQIVVAHATHSLTLLMDAYLAICNIIVLSGSIISITYGSGRSDRLSSTVTNSQEELKSLASLTRHNQMSSKSAGPERSLRNTFGWARVDVIVMLIASVFLTSLCFSVVMEALQTLIHISHHDAMHLPVPVLATGLAALALDLLAYVLIGGYTFHQGTFLITEAESVETVNNSQTSTNSCQKKEVHSPVPPPQKQRKRQGLRGLSRDCVCSLFVITCSILVYYTESEVAKFIDPALSIVSAALVFLLSLRFMTESGLILLQTIPNHINIGSLCAQLAKEFPHVVNVHELHVWQLTSEKTYCTAHIVFLDPREYSRITDEITRFFLAQGITHVTIQPEFHKDGNKSDIVSTVAGVAGVGDCLVQCSEDECLERHCCASRTPSLESVHVDSNKHNRGNSHNHKHKACAKPKSAKCGGKTPSSTDPVATSIPSPPKLPQQTNKSEPETTSSDQLKNNRILVESAKSDCNQIEGEVKL